MDVSTCTFLTCHTPCLIPTFYRRLILFGASIRFRDLQCLDYSTELRFHLHQSLPHSHFVSGSPKNILCAFLISHIRNKKLHNMKLFFFHWLYSLLGPWPLLFSFMIILQTIELLGQVISSSQGVYLNTGQHKHRINTYTHQISMP
jgi:hypothetical protein